MDEHSIASYLRTTPPACLSGFNTQRSDSVSGGDSVVARWGISCSCGASTGILLGHPLIKLVPNTSSSEFVSPLAFMCVDCGTKTELLDTAEHGYHAEIGKLEGGPGSAKIRGEGERSRQRCGACGESEFRYEVEIVFRNLDLMVDEPDLPGQDFFNSFHVQSTCEKCASSAEPVTLDDL